MYQWVPEKLQKTTQQKSRYKLGFVTSRNIKELKHWRGDKWAWGQHIFTPLKFFVKIHKPLPASHVSWSNQQTFHVVAQILSTPQIYLLPHKTQSQCSEWKAICTELPQSQDKVIKIINRFIFKEKKYN